MSYVYQIIFLLIFLLFVSCWIEKDSRRLLFLIVASFFSMLEIAALYLTGSFIDYQFYSHMNFEAVEGYGFQFVLQIVSFLVIFSLLFFAFYMISKKIRESFLRYGRIFPPVVLISFVLLCLPGGIFNEIYKVYEIVNAEEKGFDEALAGVGIDPREYITPDELTAKKGKNIIVISIESLEQGFLGESFNSIAPNLSQLSSEWTFFDKMKVSPGGGWTAASLYNHQVGMPAFFNGQGNDFFQGVKDVKLTGLGHVLEEAGYDSKYLVGNAEFAGMSDILKAYGVSVVSEKNSIGSHPKNTRNGLHDYDLFQEAKLQISNFKLNKDKPFALFLSTINTHFPRGIYDERMEAFISKREDGLEFSVSAVDYLIADLITYVESNELLDDTAIYIFPDHKLMGSSGQVIEKLSREERQLYLLTNVDENVMHRQTSDRLYQIDLPRMIIDGAEIETNASFLVDFIGEGSVDDFIRGNRVKLTTLNAASVARKTYQSFIDIAMDGDKLLIRSDEDYAYFPLQKHKYDIEITSSEYLTDQKIKSAVRVDGRANFRLRRGLNLLTAGEDGKLNLETFDIHGSLDSVQEFLARIEPLIKTDKFWAIASHDSIGSGLEGVKEKLFKLGFKKLQSLNGRKAYIAYADKSGVLMEFSSNTTITQCIPFYERVSEGVFHFTFNSEMTLLRKDVSSVENVFKVGVHDKAYDRLHLIIFVQAGEVYKTYLGNKQLAGLAKEGEGLAAYTKDEISLIMRSNRVGLSGEGVVRAKQKNVVKHDAPVVSITSSEYKTSKKIQSLMTVGGRDFKLNRGLNLLTVDYKGRYNLEIFDTFSSQAAAQKFLERLESLIKDKDFWAIAAHDAIRNDAPNFKEKLSELGLKTLQALNGRKAYIAYSDESGAFKEYSSDTTLSYMVPSYIGGLPYKEFEQEENGRNLAVNSYRRDTNRFIAHAGGKIGRHKYTNSLNALNSSYDKGFRLFELDIIKTSDGVYVAAHDWKHWARITGFKGELPPDREEFKELRIHGKYTPMDMADINLWFKNHPDAILVTDKVNTPKDFSGKFIDKTRLMMELFTWDAVKEGVDANIKSAMPTFAILGQIKGEEVEYLHRLGVTDIASSRRMYDSRRPLLKNIVDSGINVYAFHLHFEKGKDEKYVVCEEGAYFYGMYADSWDFNALLECSTD